MKISGLPIFIIGSIVNTIPGTNNIPVFFLPTCETNGVSWNSKPIPWPPNSLTTEYPFDSAWVWTASAISPRKPQGFADSKPLSKHSYATLTSFSKSGWTVPILNIQEASEKYPLYIVETSTFIISPSSKITSSLGIPWHTSSFKEVQTLFG